ncbi:NAD-dependent deacetylase, partial [bacterium]|nr:NAD-dependent deacetylase [bacterium]
MSHMQTINSDIQRAAQVIAESESIIITAGAGMGVDSGLPDFRGSQGFWKVYPYYATLGLSFVDVASPELFS